MKNYMLFVYQRSGSTFITDILEHRSEESIKKANKLRDEGVLREPEGILQASLIKCPIEHVTGPFLLETIQKEQMLYTSKVWYTYIWNWWGETNSHRDVPGPYDGLPCQWRWGVEEIKNLPGKEWKIAVQVRDPRTQIASVSNTKSELKNPQQISDPENYFITLCKGARNRYRVVIDCNKQLDNYFMYKFEDLIDDPVNTVITLLNFYKIEPDIQGIREGLKNNRIKMEKLIKEGRPHSSFGTSKLYTKRHEQWTEKRKQIFMDIVGRELEEMGYDTNWL